MCALPAQSLLGGGSPHCDSGVPLGEGEQPHLPRSHLALGTEEVKGSIHSWRVLAVALQTLPFHIQHTGH